MTVALLWKKCDFSTEPPPAVAGYIHVPRFSSKRCLFWPGRLIALLANRVGVARIDMVEDAVQDALISAMRNWSINTVPANPSAWLYTAAKNALTDRLRRARFEVPAEFTLEPAADADNSFSAEGAFNDELLRLIAFCCHPALTPASQLALTLRLACGLSVEEIAHALLTSPQSIMQRIVRAKRQLRDADVTFDIAPRELVQERLPRILNAIYLLFDAGYLSPRHPQWFRPLLCDDALRLDRMLADHPLTAEPETHALAALLHLTAARSPARPLRPCMPLRPAWTLLTGRRSCVTTISSVSCSRARLQL